jgi:hypothetical protein
MIEERDTRFELATLSLGSCSVSQNPREIKAIQAVDGGPGSPWIAPCSLESSGFRLEPSLVPNPRAELQALAAEVLARGKDALDATARCDRFAVTRLTEALSVAMELALAVSPPKASEATAAE